MLRRTDFNGRSCGNNFNNSGDIFPHRHCLRNHQPDFCSQKEAQDRFNSSSACMLAGNVYSCFIYSGHRCVFSGNIDGNFQHNDNFSGFQKIRYYSVKGFQCQQFKRFCSLCPLSRLQSMAFSQNYLKCLLAFQIILTGFPKG